MNLDPKSFECRLVPLNKKFPNIPNEEDFRPLVIISAFIKFLESRFLPKLRNYLRYILDAN